jgi:polar amino acid transport system permease protein
MKGGWLMSFDFSVISEYRLILFDGFIKMVYICVAGLAIGILAGAIVCAAKMSSSRILRGCAVVYIEWFRGTPFLIQVFILYYVGPNFGLVLNATLVGIIGLGIYSGSYFAEIYRSGIESIPRGQIEAARALGMGGGTVFFRIVFPQMMGLILAPMTNNAISFIKDSSVLSIITVQELTFAGQSVIGQTYRYVEVYIVVALLYWVVNTILSICSARLERLFTRYQREKEVKQSLFRASPHLLSTLTVKGDLE